MSVCSLNRGQPTLCARSSKDFNVAAVGACPHFLLIWGDFVDFERVGKCGVAFFVAPCGTLWRFAALCGLLIIVDRRARDRTPADREIRLEKIPAIHARHVTSPRPWLSWRPARLARSRRSWQPPRGDASLPAADVSIMVARCLKWQPQPGCNPIAQG